MYFVYMIKNDFGELYIGMTGNPRVRVEDHNTGRGAQFTRGKAKFNVMFLEEYQTLPEARQRKIQLKKWRREKKEKLIDRYQRGISTKPQHSTRATDPP